MTSATPSVTSPGRVRAVALSVVCVAAMVVFLLVVNRHYAIHRWLIWRYFGYWGAILAWGTSCLGTGLTLLRALNGGRLPATDRHLLAFPLGVFAFFLALFVVGLLGGLGAISFFGLPVAFLVLGRKELKPALVRLFTPREPLAWRHLPLVLAGAAGLLLLYVQIITPEGASYDARWYHLPLAEQYALTGAIQRSPVGWWLAAYPHLASYLYTWAFTLPGALLFDRLELCLHLEYLLFAVTLASVPGLVRRLVPQLGARFSWTVVFLFPGIFLYDLNLHGGADHVAAFWVIPIAVALARLWRVWTVGNCLLFAVFVSGLALTKYSAFCMLPFALGAFTVRALTLLVSRLRGRAPVRPVVVGAGAATLAALVLTTPHWLKNWIWYGDPLYPTLYKRLQVHPWNADSEGVFAAFKGMMAAARPGVQGLLDAASAVFTFSFIPNDWWDMHRDVPMFGSLFTLTLPCALLLRQRRLLVGYLAAMSAVFFWYLPHHYDRYLQVVLPWMAVCTAATLSLMWRAGPWHLRAAVVGLVGAQIAWGADVPFVASHNLLRDSPLRHNLRFASSGFHGDKGRLVPFRNYGQVGLSLPEDAHVLVHESPLNLGVLRRSTQDQWQGRISYRVLRTPAAIHREFVSLGFTHVMWEPARSMQWNPLGHDLAFWAYSTNYIESPRHFGYLAVGEIPKTPPPDAFNPRVTVWSCGTPYPSGEYDLDALSVPPDGGPPATPEGPIADLGLALERSGFLVIEPACGPNLPDSIGDTFHGPIQRGGYQVYVRKTKP
jgi:hypothetical protein